MKTTIGMTMQMTMTTLPRHRSQTASWCSLERSADWLRASTVSTFIRWPITSKTVVIRCRSMIAFTMLNDVDVYAVQISLDVPTIDVLGRYLSLGEKRCESESEREGWREEVDEKGCRQNSFDEQVQNITHNCFGNSHIILGISLKSSFHRMGLWETPARTQGVTTIQTRRTTVVWTLLSATKVTLATLLLTTRGSPQSRLQGGLFCYRHWQRGEMIFYGVCIKLWWNESCHYL